MKSTTKYRIVPVAAPLAAIAIGCALHATGAGASPNVPQNAVSGALSKAASVPNSRGSSGAAWRQTLANRLPAYGHRNWIVVVDSAYPAQSGAGIETVVANAGQVEVVREVLRTLKQQKHVRPVVYTDSELRYVPERDSPGISAYRKQLSTILGAQPVNVLPHESIISKLDEAGKTFRVLIIKTNMTLPYTSVFLQLDCAYWSSDAEKRLRAAMPK